MNPSRVQALVVKELLEIRRNPGVLLPMVAMAIAVAIPFVIAIWVPRLVGDRLADDADVGRAVEAAVAFMPDLAGLPPEAAAQAFLFQQFLLLFLLLPAAGAMSLAAYSIIGEKQTRSLEPLLATPITTTELLAAKVLAAALPPLVIEGAILALYFAGIAALAEPGVPGALLTGRTLLIVGVLGPLIALVALLLAAIVSSRVNDPRSAQQIGVVVILPVVAVLISQFAGVFWLTVPLMVAGAAGLAALWVALLAIGVRVFDRETILTRWR